jgi:hypothetical protein
MQSHTRRARCQAVKEGWQLAPHAQRRSRGGGGAGQSFVNRLQSAFELGRVKDISSTAHCCDSDENCLSLLDRSRRAPVLHRAPHLRPEAGPRIGRVAETTGRNPRFIRRLNSPREENVGFQFPALYQRLFSNHSPLGFRRAQKLSISKAFRRNLCASARAETGELLSGEQIPTGRNRNPLWSPLAAVASC